MLTELIIFDLDGTLIDSCEDIKEALNYCLEKRGILGFTYEEVKKMVGEGVNTLIQKALLNRSAPIPLEEVRDCFLDYYRKHITDHSCLYPEVRETLEGLKNIKKAVVSNKLTDLSIKAMENLDILKYFDFVAGGEFFPEKKPSALPILETIKLFKTVPEKTIVVGDSDIDIKAGKAANVKTVAVTYGYRDRELLLSADFLIDKLSELLNILRN